jgi:hypothetical protein
MNCKHLTNHIENFLELVTITIVEFFTLYAKIDAVHYLSTIAIPQNSDKSKDITYKGRFHTQLAKQ